MIRFEIYHRDRWVGTVTIQPTGKIQAFYLKKVSEYESPVYSEISGPFFDLSGATVAVLVLAEASKED